MPAGPHPHLELIACGAELLWRAGWSTGLDVGGLPPGVSDDGGGPVHASFRLALRGEWELAGALFGARPARSRWRPILDRVRRRADGPAGDVGRWPLFWRVVVSLRGGGADPPPPDELVAEARDAEFAERVCLLAAAGAVEHAGGRFHTAADLFKQARDVHPNRVVDDMRAMSLLDATGELAVETRRTRPHDLDRLVELYLRSGRHPRDAADAARRMLERATTYDDPRMATAARFRCGQAAVAAGDRSAAAAAFEECARACADLGLTAAAERAMTELDAVWLAPPVAESDRLLFCVPAGGDVLRRIAWSPDGELLAAGTESHVVRHWAVGAAELTDGPQNHRTALVRGVAWSPDGTRLASGGLAVCVWDARSGVELSAGRGHVWPISDVAWEPSGPRVATASDDGTVRVWAGDKPVANFPLSDASVRSVAWSPSGRSLATAAADGRCTILDPDAVVVRAQFRPRPARPERRRLALGIAARGRRGRRRHPLLSRPRGAGGRRLEQAPRAGDHPGGEPGPFPSGVTGV